MDADFDFKGNADRMLVVMRALESVDLDQIVETQAPLRQDGAQPLEGQLDLFLGAFGHGAVGPNADLAGDELVEMLGEGMNATQANTIIMAARAHWFPEGDAAAADQPAGEKA